MSAQLAAHLKKKSNYAYENYNKINWAGEKNLPVNVIPCELRYLKIGRGLKSEPDIPFRSHQLVIHGPLEGCGSGPSVARHMAERVGCCNLAEGKWFGC